MGHAFAASYVQAVREAALSRPLGDFNLDGSVNGADLSEMLNALTDIKRYQLKYGLSDAQLLAIADVNQDYVPASAAGGFNNRDIQAFLDLLLARGGGSMHAVPEPASMGLSLVAVLGVLLQGTRRRRFSAVV